MTKRNAWTPDQLLEAWGLRIDGASMGDPVKLMNPSLRSGDRCGMDDEAQAVLYVESVKGFFEVRPLLLAIYNRGETVTRVRWRQPGESKLTALMRYRRADLIEVPDVLIVESIIKPFLNALADKCIEKPFVPYREKIEDVA